MKNIVLLIISCSFLSACAVVQQAQLSSGMKQAETAMANCGPESLPPEINQAWEKVRQESAKSCPSGTDNNPLPASKAVEKNNCWTKLVNKHVRPATKRSKELNQLLAKTKNIAQSYQAGNHDKTSANRSAEMAWLEYAQYEVSYSRLAQCRNSALQQHVMPSYPHKGLLMEFMSKQSAIGLDVDKGKISQAEADIKIQSAFADLLNAEQQANTNVQAQNSKAWQQSFENIQKI